MTKTNTTIWDACRVRVLESTVEAEYEKIRKMIAEEVAKHPDNSMLNNVWKNAVEHKTHKRFLQEQYSMARCCQILAGIERKKLGIKESREVKHIATESELIAEAREQVSVSLSKPFPQFGLTEEQSKEVAKTMTYDDLMKTARRISQLFAWVEVERRNRWPELNLPTLKNFKKSDVEQVGPYQWPYERFVQTLNEDELEFMDFYYRHYFSIFNNAATVKGYEQERKRYQELQSQEGVIESGIEL